MTKPISEQTMLITGATDGIGNGTALELARRGAMVLVHGRNADPARHMIGLTSDDLKGDWERLKAAGVEFVENPTDYGTVWIATLKDPEGNLVQLLQSSRGA